VATGFSISTGVLPCPCHCTNAPLSLHIKLLFSEGQAGEVTAVKCCAEITYRQFFFCIKMCHEALCSLLLVLIRHCSNYRSCIFENEVGIWLWVVHINGLERSSSNDVGVLNVPRYSVRQTEHRYLKTTRRRFRMSIVQCGLRNDNPLICEWVTRGHVSTSPGSRVHWSR